MDTYEWETEYFPSSQKKLQIRRKNAAFRRQLLEKQLENRSRKKLLAVTAVAVVAWTSFVVQTWS